VVESIVASGVLCFFPFLALNGGGSLTKFIVLVLFDSENVLECFRSLEWRVMNATFK
jgi:hypothetical protein